MPSKRNTFEPTYQTITGGLIPLSELAEAEYCFLDIVARKYDANQDWTRFAAWWNAKFKASGLSMASAVYRICQDLEARLGINQGKVSPPDYRDYLAELIDAQFGSRHEFCRATGVDPGQLSRVLANRDNLSMKVLLQVMQVLHARLVIQSEADSREQTSIARAIEAIMAALSLRSKQCEPQLGAVPPVSLSSESAPNDVNVGAPVLREWGASFPNVQDMETVAAHAQSVANQQMPLMIPDAAA
jgi:hypothetical protein